MEKDLTAIVTELMRQGMTKEDLAKSFTTTTKTAEETLAKDAKAAIAQHPWDYPDKGALCKYYDKLVRKELDTESGLVLLLAVMKQLTPELDISQVTLNDVKQFSSFFDADISEFEKFSKNFFKEPKTKEEYNIDKTLDDLLDFFGL